MNKLFGVGSAVFLSALDLKVKSEVETWPDGEEKPFAESQKIVLRKVHNRGMCMSLFKEHPEAVKEISLVMAAILTIWDALCLRKKGGHLKKAGLSLCLAGAWSNTLDRWTRGYVVDYIGFQTPNEKLTKITYNLGDFFLMAGSILILFHEFLHYIRE